MALVKTSSAVVEIRGAVGGAVFRTSPQGVIVSSRASGKSSCSGAAVAVREQCATTRQVWSRLSKDMREKWTAYADSMGYAVESAWARWRNWLVQADDWSIWPASLGTGNLLSAAKLTCDDLTGRWFACPSISGGRLLTSVDGVRWTATSLSGAVPWIGVTARWFPLQYVAVGTSFPNRVAISPDGISWTQSAALDGSTWQAITTGNGYQRVVAVANTGTGNIAYSDDGVTWARSTFGDAHGWRDIAYSYVQQRYVAVASSGTQRCMTSEDGITWTFRSLTTASSWLSVCVSDSLGLWCAVAADGVNRVATSPDGITWTYRAIPNAPNLREVIWCYNLNVFIAVANAGTYRGFYSFDGITWSVLGVPATLQCTGVSYGGLSGVLAVSHQGPGAYVSNAPVSLLPIGVDGMPAPAVSPSIIMPTPAVSDWVIRFRPFENRSSIEISSGVDWPFIDGMVMVYVSVGAPIGRGRVQFSGVYRSAGYVYCARPPFVSESLLCPLPYRVTIGMKIPVRMRYFGRGGRMSDFAYGIVDV